MVGLRKLSWIQWTGFEFKMLGLCWRACSSTAPKSLFTGTCSSVPQFPHAACLPPRVTARSKGASSAWRYLSTFRGHITHWRQWRVWIMRTTCGDSKGNTALLFPDAGLMGKQKCSEQREPWAINACESLCVWPMNVNLARKVCVHKTWERWRELTGHSVQCLPFTDEQTEIVSLA